MEIHPPISDRTNDQLLNIIETQEGWRSEVVALAKNELIKRGISIKTQETRRTIRTKFNERIRNIKERATFTNIEKCLIVLLGPLLVLLFWDLFMFHSGDGYQRKNRQGWIYLFLGFCLWGIIIYIYLNLSA